MNTHEPYDGCNGVPIATCQECNNRLCPCELYYGHDCEDHGGC